MNPFDISQKVENIQKGYLPTITTWDANQGKKIFLKKKNLFRPFSILYMGIVRVNCDLFNHYLRERKTEKWNQDKLTSYEEKDLAYSPWISVTVWLPRGFFFFFFFNVFSLFSQMTFLPFSFKVFSFFYQLVYLFIYMF